MTFKNGALPDTRPEVEKIEDIHFEELVTSAAPVLWKEKEPESLRHFPDQFQDGSGSCVAQTLKKMLGIYIWLKTNVYIKLSATHIYKRRSNKPSSGMIGVNAFEIAKQGITLEDFAPSEKLTDQKMDAATISAFMESVGKIFAIGEPIILPTKDITTIASVIQETGKAVMTWFYFTEEEWEANKKGEYTVPEVKGAIDLYSPDTLRHSVASVDLFLYKGKKALYIEDSSPFANVSRRIITEDFFKARNWFSGYFMNFAFENPSDPVIPKPHYIFLRDLEFSPVFKIDIDVRALQDILKYEGLFPSNVESTGYFGSVTKGAVIKFQIKHGVIVNENEQGAGRIGPKTRAVLNQIYN